MTPREYPLPIDTFRNSRNCWYTKALFFDLSFPSSTEKEFCLYTLQKEDLTVDGTTYPSLYRLYMEEEDLSEWLFANKYLGGWDHWVAVAKSNLIKEHVERWRKDLEQKVRALALKTVVKEAQTSYAASRYLLDGGWKTKDGAAKGKGRPKKEEPAPVEDKKRIQADFDRLLKETEE